MKSPVIMVGIAAAVALTVAVMRFDVIGWGGMAWLAASWGSFAIRAPHLAVASATPSTANKRDRQEQLLLFGMFASMLVLPLIHLTIGLFAFADYALPHGLIWVGIVLQPLTLWLFWRSHADLGRNWSPSLQVREGHSLVDQGIYARIRHPMYSSIWLSVLTQPLLVQNWIAGVLVIPAFAAMCLLRIPREEAMMHAEFGDAYTNYSRRSGRFLPKLG